MRQLVAVHVVFREAGDKAPQLLLHLTLGFCLYMITNSTLHHT